MRGAGLVWRGGLGTGAGFGATGPAGLGGSPAERLAGTVDLPGFGEDGADRGVDQESAPLAPAERSQLGEDAGPLLGCAARLVQGCRRGGRGPLSGRPDQVAEPAVSQLGFPAEGHDRDDYPARVVTDPGEVEVHWGGHRQLGGRVEGLNELPGQEGCLVTRATGLPSGAGCQAV